MPKIAITCGDPAGVGPEIVSRWIYEGGLDTEEVLKENPFKSDYLEGDPEKKCDQYFDFKRHICLIGPQSWLDTFDLAIDRIPVGERHFEMTPGKPSLEGARIALESMQVAAQGCIDIRFKAVVTSPVSKIWLSKVGFAFPGQTEFFESAWNGEADMAFIGKKMRLLLATRHIPLAQVPHAIEREKLYRTIRNAHELALKLGFSRPRIGVCGLNPHAGEAGLIGEDEQDKINPWLQVFRADFPGLSDCMPADTIFYQHIQGQWDIVIALYHDQGLCALKTLEFDEAVNVTLGLPFLRTSPDHGTAFSIAGKHRANIKSFANAFKLAYQLSL